MRDTVLVVDDDEDFRDLMKFAVGDLGLRAVLAEGGSQGLDALRQERDRVRLVLLDYFMPGMEPKRCATELCALLPAARIVLCTAAVDAGARAASLGLTRWLAKPFDLRDLGAIIRETAE